MDGHISEEKDCVSSTVQKSFPGTLYLLKSAPTNLLLKKLVILMWPLDEIILNGAGWDIKGYTSLNLTPTN